MDRVQIQQLLMNLMVNALDAMNAVTDRPHVLPIRTSAHEPEAILVAAQDSGMGLSPEQMDRSLTHFTPPRRMAWEWACASPMMGMALPFGSRCRRTKANEAGSKIG